MPQRPRTVLAVAATLVLATAALAHTGVKDPVVKGRMALMGQIKDATGVLGAMAKGSAPFDASRAATAARRLATHAQVIPAAFAAPATDPKTEALPAIWERWDDYLAKSKALETAAAAMDTDSLDGLRAGMGAVGRACAACHEDYRANK